MLGDAGGIVNRSSFFKNNFVSSTGSMGDVLKLWEEEVERGEIARTGGSSLLTSSTVTTVTGERLSTGDSGRGFCASGISKIETSKSMGSIGVVIKGEIVGSNPRSAGEATSGE